MIAAATLALSFGSSVYWLHRACFEDARLFWVPTAISLVAIVPAFEAVQLSLMW